MLEGQRWTQNPYEVKQAVTTKARTLEQLRRAMPAAYGHVESIPTSLEAIFAATSGYVTLRCRVTSLHTYNLTHIHTHSHTFTHIHTHSHTFTHIHTHSHALTTHIHILTTRTHIRTHSQHTRTHTRTLTHYTHASNTNITGVGLLSAASCSSMSSSTLRRCHAMSQSNPPIEKSAVARSLPSPRR